MPGRTRPARRLTTISTKPSASRPRRAQIRSRASRHAALQAIFFFRSSATRPLPFQRPPTTSSLVSIDPTGLSDLADRLRAAPACRYRSGAASNASNWSDILDFPPFTARARPLASKAQTPRPAGTPIVKRAGRASIPRRLRCGQADGPGHRPSRDGDGARRGCARRLGRRGNGDRQRHQHGVDADRGVPRLRHAVRLRPARGWLRALARNDQRRSPKSSSTPASAG